MSAAPNETRPSTVRATDRATVRPTVRPGALRAAVALVLALAPLALATELAPHDGSLAPLAQLPHTDWVLFVLLVLASAPRRSTVDRFDSDPSAAHRSPRFVPVVTLALFVPLALTLRGAFGAGLAGEWSDLARPLAAVVLAAACERAAATTRSNVWTPVWWALFAAPLCVGLAFGWAQGQDAPVSALSPLALAVGDAWIGAGAGLVAALVAPVLAPARSDDSTAARAEAAS
ncbi:hypothetical protein Pla163_25650 [Planctomycetes bacterium Pla163]|uniref:Uncharacterized protein n=1 Tax=Rohdeia mirabilis TaxID=2528008 RepID=A0A518D1X5_9BACT|nr:hypothetical protein Pla163_25650 [Planctomycetes bacterium Pla163]